MSITTSRGGYIATSVQNAAFIIGIAFVAVGVMGFIPGTTVGITAGEADSGAHLAGHESDNYLFGLFHVSALHNVLHLALGLLGLTFAAKPRLAKAYLLAGGAIYLLLFAFGLLVADRDIPANFIPLNWADNWLHLGLAVVMIALGLILGRRRSPTAAS